ncbi:MAG: GNAT family N-acetyltransferase [Halanaerobiales bacterium]
MSLAKKKSKFNIRIAQEADAGEIYYLVQRAFSSYGKNGSSPASREQIEDIYTDIRENTVLIIEINNLIVGTLRLEKDMEERYYLKRFSIHPEYQGHGLGTILYYQAEEIVKEMGGRSICLYSSTEDQKLVNFYSKCGFVCIEKDYQNGYERGFLVKKIDGVD